MIKCILIVLLGACVYSIAMCYYAFPGMGRIGELHLNNVLANRRFQLNWVVENDEERSKQVQDNYHLLDTPFYRSSELNHLLDDNG